MWNDSDRDVDDAGLQAVIAFVVETCVWVERVELEWAVEMLTFTVFVGSSSCASGNVRSLALWDPVCQTGKR